MLEQNQQYLGEDYHPHNLSPEEQVNYFNNIVEVGDLVRLAPNYGTYSPVEKRTIEKARVFKYYGACVFVEDFVGPIPLQDLYKIHEKKGGNDYE